MPIHILDSETIDKIAAGEVVERPASVVKELVENAMDAGASAITVEAKDGGIEFIRVTDNGSGMEREQVRTAFLRHATSKIQNAEDLNHISSLGFRGEALSSIAAVSKVELITKTKESLTGTRILLEGAAECAFEEIGAPEGTTFLMRNLFFNTPVRRKFLKQPATEGGYIADLMEHLALSRPDISFKFVLGNQTRFHTSGSGDLREVIYRIYGREVAGALVPVQFEKDGVRIDGFLGKPVMVRSNRNFEIYYINGRFIRSNVIAKSIEEGYKEYLMQHKFPFCILHIAVDPERVDVNVHPSKMDVRFSDAMTFCSLVSGAVRETLRHREMIPDAANDSDVSEKHTTGSASETKKQDTVAPEPFETRREKDYRVMEEQNYRADLSEADRKKEFAKSPVWSRVMGEKPTSPGKEIPPQSDFFQEAEAQKQTEASQGGEAFQGAGGSQEADASQETDAPRQPENTEDEFFVEVTETERALEPEQTNSRQMNLFEEKLLSVENRSRYHIIGQVFDTYWLVQFEDKLFIIDQHAAHEKVKFERLMKQYLEKQVMSQSLLPPIIVSLSGQEEVVLKENMATFQALGFEVEPFGGAEYALRGVPVDLYGCGEKEMFLEVLDELAEGIKSNIRSVEEKIASMSCKAAVKGNNRLSMAEAEKLIDELLTLDNPYNCPHGRPTIISMTKTELEKKFKRIV